MQFQPSYLSRVATGCFYIAAQTQEEHVFIPSPAELVKLSQCGERDVDLCQMDRIICEVLQYQLDAVTPLSFLQYFYEMFALNDDRLADPSVLSALIAKLDVLMCQYQFSFYRVSAATFLRAFCLLLYLIFIYFMSFDRLKPWHWR